MKQNALTLKEARKKLEKKEISSFELTKDCFDQIEKTQKKINSFVTLLKEKALKKAQEKDKERHLGVNSPLLGIPVSIKDNFCTKDIRTTASSQVLENFIPPYNATVVNKLEKAGAIIIGKTNMDAWAHGSSTETSDYGTTKNPWNTNYLPGGSSGGAAASISADQTIIAIGSETAGSIRQPAAWCGVVGLKPTYGRVSRHGLIAMASSLDCPGPLTKSVYDAGEILKIIAGQDDYDATASSLKVEDYTKNINKSIKGLKIGVSEDYFKNIEKQVVKNIENAIKIMEKNGAKIIKIKLFDPTYAISVYTILQRSEVSSNLARYDGIRYGQKRKYFKEEAKRRILLGTYVLSAGYYDRFYSKAQKVRTIIINDFDEAFKKVDVILSPTAPSAALKIGSSIGNPMFGEIADKLVEPSSIAGLPGISVPCGFTEDLLPIGMQIVGPQFSEQLIINVANIYEQETDWHTKKPKLF